MHTGTCGVADVEVGIDVVDAGVADDGVGVDAGSTASVMLRWAALSRSSEIVCCCFDLEARQMDLNGPS